MGIMSFYFTFTSYQLFAAWAFEVQNVRASDTEETMNLTTDELELPSCKYEYLDHPADVQIHSWGDNLTEAFEQAAVAMYGYMTEIDTVEIGSRQEIEAEGHDMESLLYNFLDECLYEFSAEPFFIVRKVVITEFNKEAFSIKAKLYGEEFDLEKHPQGTEVKAITYASMQVYDSEDQHELFVIIDI
ncbi:protein archease-like isoform X1 [Homarus americanus]|uniref:protein archease-like isoform X1 n=1 Tax=Homarus americanus TaxID=6706 RepID=UPI001C490111|nr:protein archease-like isoform X1 [Homarus americanus]